MDVSSRGRGPSRRATLARIAETSGVSRSTVDRVLNARHKVSEDLARRVLEAAKSLGFHATGLIEHRIEEISRPLRIGVVLHNLSRAFYRDLADELLAAAPGFGCQDLVIDQLADLSPAEMARQIRTVAERVDALAVVAFDHPVVNECIESLAKSGKSVVAALTHLTSPGTAGYVGIDNMKAGRTAGWCLSRLCGRNGKIGLIAGSYQFRGQHERMIGLHNFFMENEPGMKIVDTVYVLDNGAIAEQLLQEMLERHPDIDGIYAIGGGVSGVIRTLEQMQPNTRPYIVCHELTDPVRAAVRSGLIDFVMDTPRDELARRILAVLRDLCLNPEAAARVSNAEFRLYCAENA